ncbi:Histone deacetylase 8 [Terramyces sp. JEL0728]|nr:Histone deacetylase 8 [Terramyces sp. JEL0728]
MTRTVGLVYSPDLIKYADSLPNSGNRSQLTHNLINAYNLQPEIIPPEKATINDLLEYHSLEYIGAIFSKKDLEEQGIYEDIERRNLEELGLVDDCAKFPDIKDHMLHVAGSSISAAKALQEYDVVINWQGGRHHAKKSNASGFCFVNDIVLCIMQLKENFKRIMYVDIDVHHGDGVEEAFSWSSSVTTCSFHINEPGYFPGSGRETTNHSTFNIPLKQGITEDKFIALFEQVVYKLYSHCTPDAIVLQCGADGLAKDPLGGWNLTGKSYCRCVETILGLNKPTVILGGGGYNPINVAKCWTSVTAKCLGVDLPTDIPEFDEWPLYTPDYTINIPASNQKDYNGAVEMVLAEFESFIE